MGLLLWAWPTQSVPHTKAINPHPTASWSIAQSSKASRTPTFDVSTRHAMRREGCWPAAALQLPQPAGGGREDELLICSQRSASVRVLRRLRARIDDWQDRDLIWSARLQLQAKQLANLPITSADRRLYGDTGSRYFNILPDFSLQ